MRSSKDSGAVTRRMAIGLAGAAAAIVGQAMAASGNSDSPVKMPPKRSSTPKSESNALSLEDRAAIETMLLHIFWLADHGRMADVADFHTEDALVTSNVPAPYDRMQGREAIRQIGIKNPPAPGEMTRHIMTALQILPNKDGTVETKCTVLRFSKEPDSPVGGCLLEDSAQTLVRADNGAWLISKRRVDMLFPLAGFPGRGRAPGGAPGGSPPGGGAPPGGSSSGDAPPG